MYNTSAGSYCHLLPLASPCFLLRRDQFANEIKRIAIRLPFHIAHLAQTVCTDWRQRERCEPALDPRWLSRHVVTNPFLTHGFSSLSSPPSALTLIASL